MWVRDQNRAPRTPLDERAICRHAQGYPRHQPGRHHTTTAESARVESDGHSIAYRFAGDGPALVLLHGFLCDSRVWRRELEDLSDRFTVVAWDAPGGGRSSDPPDPFTITEWAVCLAARERSTHTCAASASRT